MLNLKPEAFYFCMHFCMTFCQLILILLEDDRQEDTGCSSNTPVCILKY